MIERRNTKQRQAVYDYLLSVHSHPTAEEIFHKLKDKITGLTLATVYRNLHLLAGEKKILKIELNKEFHFDADITPHHHFSCTSCGRIDDMYNQDVYVYMLKELKKCNPRVEKVEIFCEGKCIECFRR